MSKSFIIIYDPSVYIPVSERDLRIRQWYEKMIEQRGNPPGGHSIKVPCSPEEDTTKTETITYSNRIANDWSAKPASEILDDLRDAARRLKDETRQPMPKRVDAGKQFDPNRGHINCRCVTDKLALDMVLIEGEYRPPGDISKAEEEELQRAHDSGDIRAEHTLALILGE